MCEIQEQQPNGPGLFAQCCFETFLGLQPRLRGSAVLSFFWDYNRAFVVSPLELMVATLQCLTSGEAELGSRENTTQTRT